MTAQSEQQAQADAQDWSGATTDILIDHILERYHARHREQLPELIALAMRVEQVHADHQDCPTGLADHLAMMQQELLNHMMKEEEILFPMLRRAPIAHLMAPISMMRIEHEQHGQALEHLDHLTNSLSLAQDACSTWRTLYSGLGQLRDDLLQHIHLENTILFVERQHPTQ